MSQDPIIGFYNLVEDTLHQIKHKKYRNDVYTFRTIQEYMNDIKREEHCTDLKKFGKDMLRKYRGILTKPQTMRYKEYLQSNNPVFRDTPDRYGKGEVLFVIDKMRKEAEEGKPIDAVYSRVKVADNTANTSISSPTPDTV